jgi:hypothetical protein
VRARAHQLLHVDLLYCFHEIHDFHEFLMTFLGMIPIIDFCVFHSSHNHYDLFYDLLQLHDLLYYFHECVGFHAMAWPVL